MYNTNNEGQLRYEKVSKDVILNLVFSPFMYSFFIWLSYLSVGTKSIMYFYSMSAGSILILIFFFYSTFRMLSRQNRTISGINFSNDYYTIKTDKILWLKAKEYEIKKSMIRIKNRKFDWYDKNTDKIGASIFINDLELFLVKDYFDDYDIIIKLFA